MRDWIRQSGLEMPTLLDCLAFLAVAAFIAAYLSLMYEFMNNPFIN